jgi:hypothetical protein
MFAELLEQKLYNILPIGHTIAAWFLRGDDLSWLNAEQKKAERRLQEKDKSALATFQQMVIGLVSQRFPTLLRLAKAQMHLLKQPERFQEVILRLSLARDIDEAQDILYSFSENEAEGDTEEPL